MFSLSTVRLGRVTHRMMRQTSEGSYENPVVRLDVILEEESNAITSAMAMWAILNTRLSNSKVQKFSRMGYRLEYFNSRGRGEAIRYLMVDNKIAYDEHLIKHENWVKGYKSKMPFSQAPALYDGDRILVQSNSILRYLGRKHDLYPTDPVTAYQVDMLNDGIEDIRNLYIKLIFQNYEAGKEEYIKALPGRLQPFENILKANNASSGAAVAGKISFVDYNLYELLDIHLVLSPNCLDSFPTLKAYHSAMGRRPNIVAYRKTDAFTSRPLNGNGKQ